MPSDNEDVNRVADGLACGGAIGAAVGAIQSGSGNIIETAVRGAVLGGLYRVAVIAGEKTGATKQLKKALRLD